MALQPDVHLAYQVMRAAARWHSFGGPGWCQRVIERATFHVPPIAAVRNAYAALEAEGIFVRRGKRGSLIRWRWSDHWCGRDGGKDIRPSPLLPPRTCRRRPRRGSVVAETVLQENDE